ncbi:homeobox protein Hox-B8a-like [Orbicella faveolata]|uniref:homeobox protein Hox-B8a-like n=1 Tax=Orbicella faveolata TaxID=48498 RepID=UPI0009E39EB8|nr:homeobox protein Hox-B8a-like [Orbicella faveolata]
MSSIMVYYQCNFCGTPPRASSVNGSVAPLQSSVSLVPFCTNGCTNVSAKALTKTSLASETGNITRKAVTFKQQEHLSFGIDRILYGSSKADLFGKRLNVTLATPRSTTRQITHSTPWSRPVFSDHQRKTLEDRFQLQHYLNKRERYHLSLCIGLTEHQIKVWFQNRRVKWRQRQKAKKQSTKLSRGAPGAQKH